MAKDLTPKEFKCTNSFACPGVFELEDGRLLIVGGLYAIEASKLGIPYGHDEFPIVIERGLLDEVLCQASAAETGTGSAPSAFQSSVNADAVIEALDALREGLAASKTSIDRVNGRRLLDDDDRLAIRRTAKRLGILVIAADDIKQALLAANSKRPIEEEPSGDDTATAAGESASLTPNSTPQEAPAGPGDNNG